MTTAIVWFRQDLRLADNPALHAALQSFDTVVPLFIDDPIDQSVSRIGAASRVWLHHSLASLDSDLTERGATLCLARGAAGAVLRKVAAHFSADAVFWNRCYDPVTRARDQQIKSSLGAIKAISYNGLLLFEPWDALKEDGTPYRVFTPFWRRVSSRLVDAVDDLLPAPERIPAPVTAESGSASGGRDGFVTLALDDLGLLPSQGWHAPMVHDWSPGEAGAQQALARFTDGPAREYHDTRNLPAEPGTSRLSPHLHIGELSPRQVIRALLGTRRTLQRLGAGEETFAKEIVWREFGYSLLFHCPHTIDEPLDERFKAFPWREGAEADADLRAWQQGRTGIPIVDAGMRELYATGWMHNRVRMVVASFLIKNLLIPWQAGERWFRDTLVDADLASNSLGWQWAAGSGADAAPFFRIFNPVLQGEKFDADGDYVRRWVPELNSVQNRRIHQPWTLPAGEREALDYPAPIVDLKQSRQRALDAFQSLKSAAKTTGA